jgi:hypothetical protein
VSEIELLTRVYEKMDGFGEQVLVVYAGAAPGDHIPILSDMFPECCFELYDPCTFSIDETEKIRVFNRLFTDRDALEYRQRHEKLVFISDIRTGIDEESVWENMLSQRRWHELMTPVISSLKFRLPWGLPMGTSVKYLDGDIYLPVWGRTSTTECRLFVDRDVHWRERMYYPLVYEEEMSHFNRVIRPAMHLHTINGGGLDRCYDCATEIFVLRQYLTAFFTCSKKEVLDLSEKITVSLRVAKEKRLANGETHGALRV